VSLVRIARHRSETSAPDRPSAGLAEHWGGPRASWGGVFGRRRGGGGRGEVSCLRKPPRPTSIVALARTRRKKIVVHRAPAPCRGPVRRRTVLKLVVVGHQAAGVDEHRNRCRDRCWSTRRRRWPPYQRLWLRLRPFKEEGICAWPPPVNLIADVVGEEPALLWVSASTWMFAWRALVHRVVREK